MSYKQQVEEVKNILKSIQDNDTKISQIEEIFEVDDSLTDVQLGLIESLGEKCGVNWFFVNFGERLIFILVLKNGTITISPSWAGFYSL